MTDKPKRPRDTNQLAKLVADLATGETVEPLVPDTRDPAAVELGRRGGLKGGRARADSMEPGRRTEIARAAAKARWRKSAPSE